MSYLFPITSTTELGVTQVGSGIDVSNGVISVQNIQGIQGVQGIQGIQGTQAAQGIQGITGNQGVQGIQGTQGTQGTQAAQGTQGTQGITGNQGVQGAQSTQGAQGTQGTQGTQGITGNQGIQGRQGIQGAQGTQAAQGTTGSQGSQGTQGITGNQGIQGIQGTQSNQGIQGIQGKGGGGDGATIGTWTPTITSSAAATITVVATTANYSKIGQQVICYFDITITVESGGSGTGAVSLSGLPFTSVASLGYVGSVIVSYFNNAQSKETTITGSVVGNSTRASLWNAHEVYDITAFTQDDIQVTTRLQGTVIYLSAT